MTRPDLNFLLCIDDNSSHVFRSKDGPRFILAKVLFTSINLENSPNPPSNLINVISLTMRMLIEELRRYL
jgi:hypothetical protein